MKPSLQLKIGQHLTMTPQLQQAIKLLQLSSLDLQQEIQQALYDNPLLELAEEEERREQRAESEQENHEKADSPKESDQQASTETEPDIKELSQDEWENKIPDELPVDASWDDVFETAATSVANKQNSSSGESRDFDTFQASADTLQDHLLWQLNLTPMSDNDRVIAGALIDAIGDDGFLALPVEDIWQGLVDTSQPEEEQLELDEVIAVLRRIQHFDPIGVGATSLSDCLLIQLRQLPAETPYLQEAITLAESHLELVARRDVKQLQKHTGLCPDSLGTAIILIQALSPRPGDLVRSSQVEYCVPDVKVDKKNNRWQVTLNNDITPALRINQSYAQLIRRADSSEQNRFLRDNLQEARSFLRSLQSRNDTLLRVAACIVEMQQGFLDQGPEAMKPMVLADVAEQLELHESTISRVTTQKFIDTPRGMYELKYFFSSHVSTAEGGQCSSTAIRAMLKKLIDEEDSAKPLSDNKLAAILDEQGIKVARRTVAKYRESLNIPSSSERKKYRIK
ncbi:RNA polymerase factor sigma-54 [bacterium SCSIO 12696]|nr:RNA polymerase factor sigma-54 [bacterium SCSIO 12696]